MYRGIYFLNLKIIFFVSCFKYFKKLLGIEIQYMGKVWQSRKWYVRRDTSKAVLGVRGVGSHAWGGNIWE